MESRRLNVRVAVIICLSSCLLALHARSADTAHVAIMSSIPGVSPALLEKAASGTLIRHLTQKLHSTPALPNVLRPVPTIMAAIYSVLEPTPDLIATLVKKGVRVFPETWTPPSSKHPLGFYLAQIPVASVADVLALEAVRKMDSAESESQPMSNQAARAIHADAVWGMGLTGSGVKVGVLDSGVDISYAGTELPAWFPKRDYSLYPQIDTLVANTVIGHGTHVTGLALARGTLSALNTGNGGGAYKGMAPGADLAFLKIGLDGTAGSTDAAEVAAIHAAVDTFHVNLFNLSYGGWDAYHDGSSLVAQTIDWAFSRGVSCFVAAGNFGNAGRHASGYVVAHDTSDYIPVTMGAPGFPLQLAFNLVWWDAAAHNGLSLLYYDGAKNRLTDVTLYQTMVSSRGTESQFSQYNQMQSQGGTYFLRVVNPSSVVQSFHLYENYGRGFVVFTFPDPNFTITSPGDADNAFTVGAYSSRDQWTGMDNSVNPTGIALGTLASFSSRGPRVDGLMKPNITAPGSILISLRDRDVYTVSTNYCVDDDGIFGGSADYYVMQGTSMASPVCAGAAALLYQQQPHAAPQQIYDALMNQGIADASTGSIPNPGWGFGKLDVYSALQNFPLPVELTSFTSQLHGTLVALNWHTATETNNEGFSIERQSRPSTMPVSAGAVAANTAWTAIGFIAGAGTSNAPHEYSFTDHLPAQGVYAYRLKQTDRGGRTAYSAVIEVAALSAPTSIVLEQNYPNPFNPSTTFAFAIPSRTHVRLSVFDVLGRPAAVLIDRDMEPGRYAETWDAGRMSSGVYFYRLEAGSHQETKKLMIQK